MKLLRFIFPFLFVRNWHTGEWELSPVRLGIFIFVSVLLIAFVVVAVAMQSPVVYSAP